MDIRDFIKMWEEKGELRRIKAEVDWNLELSHIAQMVQEKGGPALLFERIKGHESPVLIGVYATVKRLASILGKPELESMVELTRYWLSVLKEKKAAITSEEVSSGPIFENVSEGEKANILSFPVPKFYEADGHRYFGTAVYMATKDPESGRINLGTFRMAVHDERHLGVQILKGKTTDRILKKVRKNGSKNARLCNSGRGSPIRDR